MTGLQQGQLRTPPWSDYGGDRWGHSAQAALFLKRASEATLGRSDAVTIRPTCGCDGAGNAPAGRDEGRVRKARVDGSSAQSETCVNPGSLGDRRGFVSRTKERSYSAAW